MKRENGPGQRLVKLIAKLQKALIVNSWFYGFLYYL